MNIIKQPNNIKFGKIKLDIQNESMCVSWIFCASFFLISERDILLANEVSASLLLIKEAFDDIHIVQTQYP